MDISDLLVRHEKLVHLNEGGSNRDGSRLRKSAGAGGHQLSPTENHGDHEMLNAQRTPIQPPQPIHIGTAHTPQQPPQPLHPHQQPPPQPPQPSSHQPQQYRPEPVTPAGPSAHPRDPRAQQSRTAACNLDLLSDAALASEVTPVQPIMPDMGQPQTSHARVKSYGEPVGYTPDRPRDEPPPVLPPAFTSQPAAPPSYDDYNLFLDEFASSSHFLPPPFDPDQQNGAMWPRPPGDLGQRGPSKPGSQYPSRFPSVQPDGREGPEGGQPRSTTDEPLLRGPPLRISAADHGVIKNRLEEFSSVLPNDFVFPSRHTLTRFLEGYIGGFHEHLPFLHLPSLTPSEMAPELLLAILAVGAQYRFESHRGHALWYAAKAVALEQIRRRHSHEVHALLPTPAAYSPHSTRPSPSAGFRHTFPSAQQERPMTQDTHREPL